MKRTDYVQVYVQREDDGAWLDAAGRWSAATERAAFASWPAALRFLHRVGVAWSGVRFVTQGTPEND